MILLILMALQSQPTSTQAALPDPYTWSEDQWPDLYKRVTNLGSGSVASEHYRRAVAAYVALDAPEHAADIGKDLPKRIIHPTGTIGLVVRPQSAAGLRAWLRLNADALRALREATECVRAWDASRVTASAEAAPGPPAHESDSLLTLLGAAIAEATQAKNWDAAYADVIRIFRFSRHVRQTQGKIPGLEELAWNLAYDHFRLLLTSHVPDNPAEFQSRLCEAWNLRSPSAADRTYLCQMNAAALIRDDFAWAAPNGDGGSSLAETMIEMSEMLGHKTPPFKNADEYRQALLRSSIEATCELHRKLIAIQANWERMPTAEAMQTYSRVLEELRRHAVENPYTRLWLSGQVADLLRPRVMDDIQLTQRRAIVTLLSIHRWRAEKREWPESLEVLSLGEDAIDPYSGRAFVYRRSADGKSFVLYSVGFDLRDGGGKTHCHPSALGKEDSGDLLIWPPTEPSR